MELALAHEKLVNVKLHNLCRVSRIYCIAYTLTDEYLCSRNTITFVKTVVVDDLSEKACVVHLQYY
jgi:hypothetical protein